MAAYAFDPSTQDAEASQSLFGQGQPALEWIQDIQDYTETPWLEKLNQTKTKQKLVI